MTPTSTSNVAVEAAGLAVGYRGQPVVSDLDVRLDAGDSLALIGSNGSGKSTLLRTIVGLLDPVVSSVLVHGRIGYLGQTHGAAGVLALRAADVVRMGRYGRAGLVRRLGADDRRAVAEAMARMGVADLAERSMTELSGGQQQRVRLAQVLATEADVLVLDEPTAGIDAAGRERYLDAMATERARGAAIVTATHDIGEAATCSQVILLARRVVAAGSPATVLTPDHLLHAFGIALTRVESVVVATEEPHRHDHGPPH